MLHAYIFGPIAITVGYWVQRGVDTESGARVEIRRVELRGDPGRGGRASPACGCCR